MSNKVKDKPLFYIRALGCKVSQYDAEKLRQFLLNCGWLDITSKEINIPQLVILNSCSVTSRASQKCRQTINAMKRKWPQAKIVLAGCESKFRTIFPDNSFSNIDGMLPLHWTKNDLESLFENLGLPLNATNSSYTFYKAKHTRTRAFLKIQDGCNHFCSYCIVPHLRGREYSRPLAEVVSEAKELCLSGFKEIVLTGIHLGKYAFGLENVLNELESLDNLARVRLSSIEPLEVSDTLLTWMTSSPKACHHLHLPLQSGSDEILRLMRRPYNTAEFAKVIEKARKLIPNISISTDIIVGFPGETDRHFKESLDFVTAMQFSRLHIFRFSPRQGTPAADFPNQIDNRIKKERADQLKELHDYLAKKFHEKFIGHQVEVLWEAISTGGWTGLTREYILCHFADLKADLSNKITNFSVLSADSSGLFGSIDQ